MIPPHFSTIGPVVHPETGEHGTLLRSRTTGVYSFLVGDRYTSIPHRFAQSEAARLGKPSDSIQESCISAMKRLGYQPIDVAKLVPELSEAHVCAYLSRKSSIGSHKLAKLLPVLGLRITDKPSDE